MSSNDDGDPYIEWNEANAANDSGEADQGENPAGEAPCYTPRDYEDSEQGYRAAEKEADLMAGDTGLPMGIVRNYEQPGLLTVMSLAEASAYVAVHGEHDRAGARVLYSAHACPPGAGETR